jgi:tetratricopeptide (TPR) repeat protein
VRCALGVAAVLALNPFSPFSPFAAAPALAQPTSPPDVGASAATPEDPARLGQARARFRSGHEQYQQGRYREAIRDFELAASLYPSAEIAYNIALCYEQLHEYDPAIQYFERYLREKVDPPDRPAVEAKIAELRRQRELVRQSRRQRHGEGLLRIVGPPRSSIRIDRGAPVRPPVASPVAVARRSRLVAEGPGMQRFVARVGAHPGEVSTALVRLEPATRYRTRGRGRVWTWIVGGAAVAAAGAGAVFGVRAVGASADASADWDAGRCPAGRDCYADAAREADRADWAFGAALALGVAAVILWFVEGASDETEVVGPAPR